MTSIAVESYLAIEFIYCGCNCGFTRSKYDSQGRERGFIFGHDKKGKKLSEERRKKLSEFRKTCIREKHSNWKNGIHYRNGYRYIFKPDYPFSNKSGYILEHRYVYEQYYNCCLLKWTDIHHINGIKTDNSINNLEAMIHGRHMILEHTKDMSNRLCEICNGKTLILKNNPDNLMYGLKTIGW